MSIDIPKDILGLKGQRVNEIKQDDQRFVSPHSIQPIARHSGLRWKIARNIGRAYLGKILPDMNSMFYIPG